MGQELDLRLGLPPTSGQYGQCTCNGMVTTSAYPPHHVTIARESQVDVAVDCLIGMSLFVMMCCCVPFGIIATMKALEARSRQQVGDAIGAQSAANSSRMWAGSGMLLGCMLDVAIIVYVCYTRV